MGAVRRGYARRFGAAADTCYALRQCRFAALTLFVAPILPARSIRCSRHVPQLGVLLRLLARYPSWVSCCVFWLDDGHTLHSAHCVRNRVPPIRFDAISQFAASVLYSGTSLIPPLLSASFCWLQILVFAAMRMWHRVGRVWHCSVCAKLSLIFTLSLPSFLGSFRLSSCLLRICFESTVGAFLNNLLLFDIWSELSTFWHKFAVVHDEKRIVPAFANRDLGFCKSEASLGSN